MITENAFYQKRINHTVHSNSRGRESQIDYNMLKVCDNELQHSTTECTHRSAPCSGDKLYNIIITKTWMQSASRNNTLFLFSTTSFQDCKCSRKPSTYTRRSSTESRDGARKLKKASLDSRHEEATKVHNVSSEASSCNVDVGFHQGSALSPYLLLILMAVLTEEVRT